MPGEREKKGAILVVDDNPSNLGLLFEYLRLMGFEVWISQDGEEAIKMARDISPDIILLDVMMPGIDGFETCQQLKAHEATKDIPVIFVTALTNTVDKIKGFKVGGIDYITKPFQPEEVGIRINTHLTMRRLQQQFQQQNALLHQQKEELSQLNASKDKFFSIIAHDLRTPLTALLTYTRFATESLESFSLNELQEMVKNLRNTSEHLYELLENLLDWSMIQRGMMHYYPRYLDLQDILLRNLTLFEVNARQKHISLNSLIHERTQVYADERVVDVVVRNLLSNAVKFTPAYGRIEVSATEHAAELAVSVSDTGTGISPDDLPKLFRIDEKSQHTGTEGERGTGLGLILCKELLEVNGGQLSVKSIVGKGSTFTFTLPREP